MSDSAAAPTPPARPRWYQFRLRTLLAAVTLVATALWAFLIYVEPYRAQRRTMELIKELGGRYIAADPAPWQRRLLGGDQQNITLVDLADCDEPQKYLWHIARLPRLETLVVGGEAFGDEQLQRLAGLSTLRGLVLDSTSVSEAALAAWRERFHEIEVYNSQRQAIVQWSRNGGLGVDTQVANHERLAGLVGAVYFEEVVKAWNNEDKQSTECELHSLQRFHTLVALELKGPKVGDAVLAHIHRFPQLVGVDLSKSQATDVGLQHLSGLSKLIMLDLRATQIGDGCLAQAPTTLEDINLSGTRIGDAALRPLEAMTNLERLDLTETRVGDTGLASLRSLARLTHLSLDGTRVTDAGLEHLKGCDDLESLTLGRTRVTNAGLAQLKGLQNLIGLHVDGTKIDDAGMVHIRRLGHLITLSLEETCITDTALEELKQMPNLQFLYVRGTKITGDAVRQFRKALPQCEVFGP